MARRYPRDGLDFSNHNRPRPSLNVIRTSDLPPGLANMLARDIAPDDLPANYRNAIGDNDNTIIVHGGETHIYSPTNILNDVIRELHAND